MKAAFIIKSNKYQKIEEVRKLKGRLYESVGRKFESCRARQ
jgi:hypothetical protein